MGDDGERREAADDPVRAAMDAAEGAARGVRGRRSMGPWTWAVLLIIVLVIVTTVLVRWPG